MNCQAGVIIVGHRGASAMAPENTLAAFKLAFEQNADAIEGDFYLTKDRQIVCLHDKTTKRVAKEELVVAQSTLEQLRQLDVGAWKGDKWKGEKIPTLTDVLRIIPKEKKILIEIKCGAEIVPFLKQTLSQCVLEPQQITIIVFDKEVVRACKQQMPKIKCNWLVSFKQNKITRSWKPSPASVLKTLKEINADGLGARENQKVLDNKFATSLSQAGIELHVWTVDDQQPARYFQKLGVKSITTNKPAKMREYLDR